MEIFADGVLWASMRDVASRLAPNPNPIRNCNCNCICSPNPDLNARDAMCATLLRYVASVDDEGSETDSAMGRGDNTVEEVAMKGRQDTPQRRLPSGRDEAYISGTPYYASIVH